MAGLALRAVDGLVEVEPAPRVARIGVQHERKGVDVQAGHQPGTGDWAGVDHRVHGRAGGGTEADLVEGVAARLDTDAAVYERLAESLECQAVGERLRHRLDREANARISHLVDHSVERDDADAEVRCVTSRELRDVGRDFAFVKRREPIEETGEVVHDRGDSDQSLWLACCESRDL
jgi:hypothetical protein